MEEVEKDPEEASERSVLSENQEAKSGVSTQGAEKDPSVDVEDRKSQLQKEVEESEKLITPQRIINLQRDLYKSVTNIQAAADAKESRRRRELEEARRLRLERLESHVKSGQEKFEEITRGWSIAQQKVIPQELQEALSNQQQLCAAIVEDKKKLINDLQQELKAGDDSYVKDLRRMAEELGLMMERMEDQIKTLTKACREEQAQIKRVYQQEGEVLLTKKKTEWEQLMKELLDKELEWLTQRQKKVEEYEAKDHNMMLKTVEDQWLVRIEQSTHFQVLERQLQKMKADKMIINLVRNEQKREEALHNINLAQMKDRIPCLQTEFENLMAKHTTEDAEFKKKSRYLSEDYKRYIEQYERMKKKIKHFAVADVRKFEEMWLMLEAEVKELVERVLVIDLLICKHHLGLAWERPPMVFMELSGPIQPQKQAWRPTHHAASQSFQTGQAPQHSERMMDASVGPRLKTDTDSTDMEMYKEGTAVQSESGAEVEEGKLSMETVKKVMELLCDEAGFLMEDKLINLLDPLEKDEQTVVKLGCLLCSFGLEEEDVPKLVHFLMKHQHQQRKQTEDVCVESGESSNKAEEVETNSELIDRNHVVPALKSFLEQLTRSRENSARQHLSVQQVEARDTSQDEAYWDSMGNIISEDKLKLWDVAENKLKQYHAVLTEISDLIPETQSLEQQNKELRMLLQQSLNSTVQVSTELEMP